MDIDDLLTRAKREFKEAQEHSAEWRAEARDDFDLYAGEQWSDRDKASLREVDREATTFNRVAPLVDSVCGQEAVNRTEIKFIPRTEGDAAPNDVLTGAAAWVRDLSGAEDEEADAFQDMVIGGQGWVETYVDYENDPDGAVRMRKADSLEIYLDPDARRKCAKDARHLFHGRRVPIETARRRWPDGQFSSSGWMGFESDTTNGLYHRARELYDGDGNASLDESQRVEIIRYQWHVPETRWRVSDPYTGTQADVDAEGFANYARITLQFLGRMPVEGQDYVEVRVAGYYEAYFSGDNVLEVRRAPVNAFSYDGMTGRRDRNQGGWFGIVRAMRDPQKWSNTFFSLLLKILQSNAKGGLLVEEGAVDNEREFEDSYAQSDAVTWISNGGLGKIQNKQAPAYPQSLDRLMQISMDGIYSVSGMNMEMLGLAGVNQPGVVEMARKQSGLTIIASLFDSLRAYREQQGRTLLQFIRRYITDERLVKIVGDEGARYVPLAKMPDTMEFDVIVDDVTNAPSERDRTWQAMTEMLPIAQALNAMPPIEAIIKASPLPETFRQEWLADIGRQRQMAAQASQQPPPEMQVAQAAAQLKQQELQINAAESASKQQLDQAKFAHQVQMDQAKLAQDERQDVRDAQVDLAKARLAKVPTIQPNLRVVGQ